MDYTNMSNGELEQLAAQKDGEAICELGNRCLYGTGGYAVNYTRAYQWFHKGEKMGLPKAYVGLGEMYRNGLRFARNEDVAKEYYQKAGIPYPGSVSNSPKEIFQEDLIQKLNMAEEARANQNYRQADALSLEVIGSVEQIKGGQALWNGMADPDLLMGNAYWIMAFTAFNEQNYQTMESLLSRKDVMLYHPWGAYIQTAAHRIMNMPQDVIEQDLRRLLDASYSQELSGQERGDVCGMIGDLICEGYGQKMGLNPDAATGYYQEAADCGNIYAKEVLGQA